MHRMAEGMSELSQRVIGCVFTVHNELGPGFLEAVYKNALLYELSCAGIQAEAEAPLSVCYKSQTVGVFYADLIVEHCLICELKAVRRLDVSHEMQLVNYLKATGLNDGLLINFGSARAEIKHKYRLNKDLKSM